MVDPGLGEIVGGDRTGAGVVGGFLIGAADFQTITRLRLHDETGAIGIEQPLRACATHRSGGVGEAGDRTVIEGDCGGAGGKHALKKCGDGGVLRILIGDIRAQADDLGTEAKPRLTPYEGGVMIEALDIALLRLLEVGCVETALTWVTTRIAPEGERAGEVELGTHVFPLLHSQLIVRQSDGGGARRLAPVPAVRTLSAPDGDHLVYVVPTGVLGRARYDIAVIKQLQRSVTLVAAIDIAVGPDFRRPEVALRGADRGYPSGTAIDAERAVVELVETIRRRLDPVGCKERVIVYPKAPIVSPCHDWIGRGHWGGKLPA